MSDEEGAQATEGKAAYAPPATQADLDRIIADRLSRQAAKFADYDDLRAKATKLAEIEEASKTEAQRQGEALAEAQARIAAFEQREQVATWKAEVSRDTGIPAAALAGATKEEIEAHAATLKELIPAPADQQVQTVSTIGKTPASPANVSLPNQIAAAEKAGDKQLVAVLKAMQLGSTN